MSLRALCGEAETDRPTSQVPVNAFSAPVSGWWPLCSSSTDLETSLSLFSLPPDGWPREQTCQVGCTTVCRRKRLDYKHTLSKVQASELHATRLCPCERAQSLGPLCSRRRLSHVHRPSLPQRHYDPPLLEEPSCPPHTKLSMAWDGPCERFGLYLYWLWGTETRTMLRKQCWIPTNRGQHTEVTVGS